MRYFGICLVLLLVSLSSALSAELREAPEELYTPQLRLYFYACEGSVDGVKKALAEGAKIDEISDAAYSALHYAIHLNRVEVVEYLLQNGANPNVQSGKNSGVDWKASPLLMATVMGHLDAGKLLLKAGADPRIPNGSNKMDSIAYALQENRAEFVDLFVKAGLDISNAITVNGRTVPALTFAARHGSLDLVKLLVEDYKVSVNPAVKDAYDSPIFTAIRYGNIEVVKYLIAKGADIHKKLPRYNSGWLVGEYSSLYLAAVNGRIEITHILLDNGAKPTKVSSRDFDPVFLADALGHEALLELYESYGYKSNYWGRLKLDAEAVQFAGRRSDVVPVDSLFAAEYLEGDWRGAEVKGDSGELGVGVAIIGDDFSKDLTSLLAAEWSTEDNIDILERDEIDALLREHRLSRSGVLAGNAIASSSAVLGADLLLLVRKIEVKGSGKCSELRLIDSRNGILLDTRFSPVEERRLETFCSDYVRYASGQIAKFKNGLDQLQLLSVVNVRADFGNAAALQLERQAHRLLEYELANRSDVLLLERQSLDTLKREDQLSGAVNHSFRASSGFVDARLKLNESRDGIQSIHLRLDLAGGESRSVDKSLKGKAFAAALSEAISELIDGGSISNDLAEANLNEDYKQLVSEARWLRKVGLHHESLRYIRNAVVIKDDKLNAWRLYLMCLSDAYPKLPKQNAFADPMNFERVFMHEQERLYVMNVIYRMLAERGGGEVDALLKAHDGFDFTITSLDAVALHRLYGERIKLLEEDYLAMVDRRILPLFSLCKNNEIFRDNSYNSQTAKVLRAIRSFRETEDRLIEVVVKDLMSAFSQQFADPSFWPMSVFFRGYTSYAHNNTKMGWMREAQLLDWVVDSADPYLAYVFVSTLYRDGWPHRRSYSRSRLTELAQLSSRLLNQMSSRNKIFYHLNSFNTNNPHDSWIGDGFLSTSLRKIPIGEGYLWQPIDDVAFKTLLDVLKPKYTRKELQSHESETKQLRYTLKLFEGFVSEFPWARARSDAVRSNLKEHLPALEAASPKGGGEVKVGTFPVSLWHPSAYGFENLEAIHEPVFEEGYWYVVGSDISSRRSAPKRYVLFKINASTLAIEIKDIVADQIASFRTSIYGNAYIGDEYLYFSVGGSGRVIVCVNLHTLRAEVIEGFRSPSGRRSSIIPQGAVFGGKFYGLVTAEDNVKNLKEKSWSRLFIEYDPSTKSSRVIANSRREPAENELDSVVEEISGVVFSQEHQGILLVRVGKEKVQLWDPNRNKIRSIDGLLARRPDLDQYDYNRYLELGVLTQKGHWWWKHHHTVYGNGKWKRYAKSHALIFTNWDVDPYLWKAVEFTWENPEKTCPQFDALNAALESNGRIRCSPLSHDVERGYFVTNENVLAFFKTEDLAAALKQSDLLPER